MEVNLSVFMSRYDYVYLRHMTIDTHTQKTQLLLYIQLLEARKQLITGATELVTVHKLL